MTKALDKQVGGDHYKTLKIQPTYYSTVNLLYAIESNIIKYATRHKTKGGAQDVRKIIHYAELAKDLNVDVPNRELVLAITPETYYTANKLGQLESFIVKHATHNSFKHSDEAMDSVIELAEEILSKQY